MWDFQFDLVLVDLSFHLIWYCWSFLLRSGTEFPFDLVLLGASFLRSGIEFPFDLVLPELPFEILELSFKLI